MILTFSYIFFKFEILTFTKNFTREYWFASFLTHNSLHQFLGGVCFHPLSNSRTLHLHKTYGIHYIYICWGLRTWSWTTHQGPCPNGENWFSVSPCSCFFTSYLLFMGLWEAVDVSVLIWKETPHPLLKAWSHSHSKIHPRAGIGCCSPQRKVENDHRTQGSRAVEIGKAFWHSFRAERKLCTREAQGSRGKIPV